MENLIYVLFFCMVIPFCMMLIIVPKGAKMNTAYIIVGITICLFISEVNSIFMNALPLNMFDFTTTVSPITEELIKYIPIIFFIYVLSDDKDKVIGIAFAEGVGFSVLENIFITVQNISAVSPTWALARGISSALVHSVTCLIMGLGFLTIKKKKKLIAPGILSLWSLAVIYHAIFNSLIQSKYNAFGIALPLLTFLPEAIIIFRDRKKNNKKNADNKIAEKI